MALDQLGKQFADNCFFASTQGYYDYVQKYDIETVLTRMLLKSMIEYLSQTSNLSLESLLSTVGTFGDEQV